MKLRSTGCDHGLISCRDGNKSATSAVAYLTNDESYDEYDYDYEYECDYDDTSCHGEVGIGLASLIVTDDEHIENEDVVEDELMSYCDVGLNWGEGDADDEFQDYDGWYLVGHSQ